ncbi:MAG: bifunctional sulfate adenylyltransferase subunit 1/adenylylsulfate kinase [Deltaproteobacteria bacterium HGW-Deltaproteobacteria-6]|jgi:bifunctional enzyme CysN/CysC|nr:MAG: bifunctional sulfate adenylyltransferase subunit 1/adenylylsulfate kinase [Deltaproteobacteria bacterium HGW-Deltaproteobacteria-6]
MKYREKSLLRFTTTGSVDDGKSTLIGRLLFETKSIFEDQYDAIKKTSIKKGYRDVDLALLLDGLSAEREQGITIDVAYRYFETPTRKFIIADTPGHTQYTRNMVTGASTADCSIILIDARNGVLTQSKRHGFIASLLQIPHMVVAVNKMDLVDYSEDIYNRIVDEYRDFSEKLEIHDVTFIPVSALKGDNVVEKSANMPWYEGGTLLHYLENLHVSADRNLVDFRFPVQYVIRPDLNFRGFAGRIVSGTICPGEAVIALPSGQSTTIKAIQTFDGELQEAFAPQSVVLTMDDEIDISRGDMIVRKNNIPQVGHSFEAVICWMDEQTMIPGSTYILKQTTNSVKAHIAGILYKIDVNTLHRESTDTLMLNEIGRVNIVTVSPVFFDAYKMNHSTGSFILIDPLTNHTVAGGMIRGVARAIDDIREKKETEDAHRPKSPHIVWGGWNIPREQRETRNGHRAAVLWLTGYSGSGKSTIAKNLEKKLYQAGCQTVLLDGDNIRHGLCGDLGFSENDRHENIRRVGETAKLFFESGNIVICTFISPFAKDRLFARSLFPPDRFYEIYVKCDLDICVRRDPNGLYKKSMSGAINNFTGISSPYEEPANAEMVAETEIFSPEDIVGGILEKLLADGIISERHRN